MHTVLESSCDTFSANGKLLLTGEYAVLFGSKALALPARKGQRLEIRKPGRDGLLHWTSREHANIWFTATLSLPCLDVLETSDNGLAIRLRDLLRTVRRLSPSFLGESDGIEAFTDLDFPRNWGLGTSSTLLYLVSHWAGVDPYLLLDSTFGGSGYDIACADRFHPILYQRKSGLPEVEETSLDLPFLDQVYIGFSGVKKDSGQEVRKVMQHGSFPDIVLERISSISEEIRQCKDIQIFNELMEEHERLLSTQLGLPPLASAFPGYPGLVKSLGAWGGDFHLFTWTNGTDALRGYLGRMGIGPIFPIREMLYTI